MTNFLYNVAAQVSNHVPYGTSIAAEATAKYSRESAFSNPVDLGGRVKLLFAGATTLLETVGSLFMTVVTSAAVGLTSGSYGALNEVAKSFRNNTLRSLYYTATFAAGAIIHPAVAQAITKTKILSSPLVEETNQEMSKQEIIHNLAHAGPGGALYAGYSRIAESGQHKNKLKLDQERLKEKFERLAQIEG